MVLKDASILAKKILIGIIVFLIPLLVFIVGLKLVQHSF